MDDLFLQRAIEADLKELGLPMGPRKAILEAAQQLAKGNTLREDSVEVNSF